jgi:hypothetical protein
MVEWTEAITLAARIHNELFVFTKYPTVSTVEEVCYG